MKRKVKKWLINHPRVYNFIWVIVSYITNYSGREHKRTFGKNNEDITFYVIRPRTNSIEGLMSLFIYSLQRIEYAERKGYVPIIDWLNYKTQYYDGKSNVWEWFFSQPCNFTLDEVYSSKNVILSGYKLFDKIDKRIGSKEIFFDTKLCEKCNRLVLNNIMIKSEISEKVNNEKKNIPIQKCLGVYLRGTDYVKLKPIGEQIQPSVIEMLEKIREFRNKYDNPPVFLVTEDFDIYNEIKEQLGEDVYVVSFDSFIAGYDGKDFLSRSNVLNNDKLKLGTDYLTKLLLLTECKYLLTSITCGSIATRLFNNTGYEDMFVFELGQYE